MPAAHQPDKVVDVIQAVFFPFQGYNPSAFRPLRSVPGCGSAPFQARQCINLHKLLVVPVYLGWIYAYGGTDPFAFTQKFAPAAIVLLVAHGLYGVLWVFKDVHFGDERWKAKMSPLGFLVVFTSLALYYLPMWCLVSRSCPGARFGEGYEPQLVGAGLLCYCLGCFYHFAADCQKHHVLAHRRPRSLITDGLFAHSRNPGYFGEILIYVGFAIFSMHYCVLLAFVSVWLIVFLPNMLAKEASMSRYPEWQAWANRTGFLVPWLPALLYDLFVTGLLPSPAKRD